MAALPPGKNVVLIGMPGVGKSTIGVLTAKTLVRPFIDTDLLIQAGEGRGLQAIIDSVGLATFRAIEECYVLALNATSAVIATGGSVIHSARIMEHLKRSGFLIHLHAPLAELQGRITDMDSRGIAMDSYQSFESLYHERTPLYERHADAAIDCAGLTHEQVRRAVVAHLL